jgi:hypothetical protein
LKNEADDDEKDIVVKAIKEEEKEKKVDISKVVNADDSIETAIEEGESEEDSGILTSDGKEKAIREYVTNLCVPHSQESGIMTGGRKRKVIIPADSDSSDEESGS